MIKHKSNGLLYYISDTHWNRYAAYLAFDDNMRFICGNEYQKKHYIFSRFIYKAGDLGKDVPDYQNNLIYDGVEVELDTYDDISFTIYKSLDSVYFKGVKKELSATACENYNWQRDLYVTYNSNAPINKTLIVFGDSFYNSSSYMQYCEGLFSHVVSMHRSIIFDASDETIQQILNKFSPDLIIYETVERDL